MTIDVHSTPHSDLPVPPGELLVEELAVIGMTRDDLAIQLGQTLQSVDRLILGETQITADVARGLERILGSPAQFWVNLDARYRLTLSQQQRQADQLGPQE